MMRLPICALLCAGTLGLCLAVPGKTVRWCTISNHEARKCSSFSDNMKRVLPEDGPHVTCVKRTSHLECIKAITANEADAVTVEAGLVFEAGLPPFNLKPIVAEFHGSKNNPQTLHYAVAVVKKDSNIQLKGLQGKKSCHPGLGWSAGWNIPIRIFFPSVSVEEAATAEMAQFFVGSCVPCANRMEFPRLCQLCVGEGTDKCACSFQEPYFGYSGAFKCLQDGVGDVAFLRHVTVFENLANMTDSDHYDLLCLDNSRKSVDKYRECHLALFPSHAVMARNIGGKEDLIWELLNQAQEHFGKGKSTEFQLFASPHGKDLLFTDATDGFLRVPPKMDAKLYVGYEYFSAIQRLKIGVEDSPRVRWCAVGHHERVKCDEWSVLSGGALECTTEETTEDCIAAIAKGEADAMTLDGGFIYTAGQCRLVPVLAENYMPKDESTCVNTPAQGHYVVAVIKKSDPSLTWYSLQGKKSCHPAVGTSAGWIIPMGLIYNKTGSCKFDEFFSQSCAPGSDPNSNLCALCSGGSDPAHTCAPNNHERYYGFSGAFRCLVEKGDVAFVKETTVFQNTEGKNPEAWAKDLKQEDFELLCLDGTRRPVTEAHRCHLAIVPNHAVVSRKDKAASVRRMLFNQQELFGRNGFEYRMFQMFQSSSKDLLFSDDTACLANLQDGTTYRKYLGPEYLKALDNMGQCLHSELQDACTFHVH
ncbi:inhibitor of carbonic anhydrase isoform X1 [Canis lupus familiaris]|uniref:inhibitor of carbonic anhydrase isoform X1 n=2 Tax=Canis lupus familiaris TaxID=9615 RepID=UPI0018F7DA30|nr:inhibitor of carbonic anhydrase isoform X1 [Canis lupus familiaris]